MVREAERQKRASNSEAGWIEDVVRGFVRQRQQEKTRRRELCVLKKRGVCIGEALRRSVAGKELCLLASKDWFVLPNNRKSERRRNRVLKNLNVSLVR